jgi:hypothetical protein
MGGSLRTGGARAFPCGPPGALHPSGLPGSAPSPGRENSATGRQLSQRLTPADISADIFALPSLPHLHKDCASVAGCVLTVVSAVGLPPKGLRAAAGVDPFPYTYPRDGGMDLPQARPGGRPSPDPTPESAKKPLGHAGDIGPRHRAGSVGDGAPVSQKLRPDSRSSAEPPSPRPCPGSSRPRKRWTESSGFP